MGLPAQSATPQKTFSAQTIAHYVQARLEATPLQAEPYAHWHVTDFLPADVAQAITELPIDYVPVSETYGKRDSHNELRQFFSPDKQALYPVIKAMAEAFQMPRTVYALQDICHTNFFGNSLRIEYCQDNEGFWLEPHTDIGAKVFTLVLYLTPGAEGLNMGTDIYDHQKNYVGRSPSPFNSALIFVPGANTWHGFEKRPMPVTRKSLIINFVKPEWRARNELCFPNDPVNASKA